MLLITVLPLAWIVNIVLLPAVALYPPTADLIRELVDEFGVEGVDPRDSPLRPEGTPNEDHTARRGWP